MAYSEELYLNVDLQEICKRHIFRIIGNSKLEIKFIIFYKICCYLIFKLFTTELPRSKCIFVSFQCVSKADHRLILYLISKYFIRSCSVSILFHIKINKSFDIYSVISICQETYIYLFGNVHKSLRQVVSNNMLDFLCVRV